MKKRRLTEDFSRRFPGGLGRTRWDVLRGTGLAATALLLLWGPDTASALSRSERQWNRLCRRIEWKDNRAAFQKYVEEYRVGGDRFGPGVLTVPKRRPLQLDSDYAFDAAAAKPEWIQEIFSFAKQPVQAEPLDATPSMIEGLVHGERAAFLRESYFEPLYTPDPEHLPASWFNLVAVGSLDSAREREPSSKRVQPKNADPLEKGLDFEVTEEELPKETSRIWIID